MENSLKLVIDARPLARASGGIHRYLKNILEHLVERDDVEFILYSDNLSEALEGFAKKNNVTIRAFKSQRFAFLRWFFYSSYWLRIDKPDCFWSPRHDLPLFIPSNCRSVVTIHDMVWKTVPKTMPFMKFVKEKFLMPLAIKKANAVIAVSGSTKQLIGNYFPENTQKVKSINNASFVESNTVITKKRADTEPFFLAVGTLEPRKNYVKLLQAFDEYIKQGGKNNLIIVGRKGWKYQEIFHIYNSLNHQDRMVIKEDVNDSGLLELYKTAQGFISVSLDEGFGLPAAEAQSCGLPMMLSDILVYRELFSEAVCWTSPIDLNQIVRSLFALETALVGLTKNVNVNVNVKEGWHDVANLTFQVLMKN